MYDVAKNFQVSPIFADLDYECKNSKKVFRKIKKILNQKGYNMQADMSLPNYFRDSVLIGRKNDLYVRIKNMDGYGNIRFFEMSWGTEDKEISRISRFTYMSKLQYKLCISKIRNLLLELGFEDQSLVIDKTAVDTIKRSYVMSNVHEQTDMNFKLSDLDGTSVDDLYSRDRDEKQILNGDIKYFRDCNGYLNRGKVYHNYHDKWWIIANKKDFWIIEARYLFDLTASDNRHRDKKGQYSEKYLAEQKVLNGAKDRALIRVLQERGYNVTKKK